MELDYLRLLYAYNNWATQRILDQAVKLTLEQFNAPGDGGYGSMRDTLVHILEAEWIWLFIWQGKGINPDWDALEFTPADYPDMSAIQAKQAEIAAELRDFVAALTSDDVNSPRQVVTWSSDADVRRRPLWQLMLHVANHGTQHRSEAAAMLTRLGHSPGELDLTQYLREAFPEEPA